MSILVIVCFDIGRALSQKRYETSNFVVSNTVYNAYRDSKGYIWFATDRGALRFDGKNFLSYTLLDGVPDNDILNFYEDKDGRLWLYTYNGNSCYILNGKVHNASNDSLLKRMPAHPFVCAMLSTDSALYIAYKYGTVIRIKDQTITYVSKNAVNGFITALLYDRNELKIISSNKVFTIRSNKPVLEKTVPLNCSFLYRDSLFVINPGSIEIQYKDKVVWSYADSEVKYTNTIKLVPAGNNGLFCCSRKGLSHINLETRKKTVLISNIAVSSVCADVCGNYWVTTLSNGIYYFKKELNDLHFIGNVNNGRLISKNHQLFHITNDSIYLVKASGRQSIPITFSNGLTPICDFGRYFIYNRNDNSSWFLNKQNRKSINLFESNTYGFPYDSGGIIFTNIDVLFNRCIINNNYIKLNHLYFNGKILHAGFINDNRYFYVITSTALHEYNPKDFSVRLVDSFLPGQSPVGAYSLDDKLVVVTGNNKMFVYTSHFKDRIQYSIKDYSIFNLFRAGSRLIALTNKGYYLVRLVNDKEKKVVFTSIQYPFNESEITDMYPAGGDVICNVRGNLYSFNGELINKVLTTPAIFIDKITVNAKVLGGESIVVKNANVCNLTFQLSSLYFGTMHIRYKYRLKYDDQYSTWYFSKTGEFNILLPHFGKYEVELKSISDDNFSSQSKFVQVEWVAPFYFTWWFKVLTGIVVMSIAGLVLFKHNRRRKRSFEQELDHLQLENKAINSVLNPHFIFNAINNIQNLVNVQQTEEANEYLGMLSRLIRQNIENLQFNLITVDKELNLISNYIHLQNLRYSDSITLEVDDSTEDDFSVPPLLIHTFVENSVVHGFLPTINDFTIRISMKMLDSKYVQITISDNGTGITKDKAEQLRVDKTSIGINATERRLERISRFYKVNYTITIADQEDRGTIVTIVMYAGFASLLPDR